MGSQPTFGLSFSSASGRWYPVTREAVSPDGSRYAYTLGSGIHIVTAANGSDTVIGSDKSWRLVLLVNDGAYAAPGDQAPGLWFVPLSGSPKQVIDSGWWMTASASSGIAYGQRAQTELETGLLEGMGYRIRHLDGRGSPEQPGLLADSSPGSTSPYS